MTILEALDDYIDYMRDSLCFMEGPEKEYYKDKDREELKKRIDEAEKLRDEIINNPCRVCGGGDIIMS